MSTDGDQAIRKTVARMVEAAGFDVDDIVTRRAGQRRLVRVVIDGDDGVALDDAARLTREISSALDGRDEDLFGGAPYTLEVTSRGVDAPLTQPRHFQRAAGRLVAFSMTDGSTRRARIAAATGQDVIVLARGDDGLYDRIPLTGIRRAIVQIEFSPPGADIAALITRAAESALGSKAAPYEGEDAR